MITKLKSIGVYSDIGGQIDCIIGHNEHMLNIFKREIVGVVSSERNHIGNAVYSAMDGSLTNGWWN